MANQSLPYLFALVVIIFYLPLLILVGQLNQRRVARRRFFQATHAILQRVADNSIAIEQIYIVYKKLAERFTYIGTHYKNATDFVEDLLARTESLGTNDFKRLYRLEFSDDERNRVAAIITTMKERQPFSSISSKYGNLLGMVKHALNTGNADMGLNNLAQLADDIEVLESTIKGQSRRNQVSMIVSIVGVILTIVFGAVSLIPLLPK